MGEMTRFDPADRYLSTAEVAKKLNVSRRTIVALAKRGALKAIRVGKLWRFDARDFAVPPDPVQPVPPQSHVLDAGRPVTPEERAVWIVRSMSELGYSQKEIAAMSGLSASAVSRTLAGQVRQVRASAAKSFATALRGARARRIEVVLRQLDATVVAVSTDADGVAAAIPHSALLDAVIRGLVNPMEDLPSRVNSVLIGLGRGNYLIRLRPDTTADPREEIQRLLARD